MGRSSQHLFIPRPEAVATSVGWSECGEMPQQDGLVLHRRVETAGFVFKEKS